MARATRNSKAAPAVSSPPARRTRSKLKEKDATSNNNNPTSSSSQPVDNAVPPTDPTPATAQKAPTAKKTTGKTKPSAAAKASDKASVPASTTAASSSKASLPATTASATHNNTTSEDSDNTAPARKATGKRSRRQPTVDRNAKNKVTKSRARKPATKTSAAAKKALEQHVEEEEAAATPARPAPTRRTRAALRAGIASPLAPVSENISTKARQTRSKKNLKDATPLSIIENENDPKDPDDWFAEVQQEPRIYRDPGASMEEISEREDTAMAENDDIVEHDTASSDADEAMGGDVEMVAEETEHDASETEEDMADEEIERPQTPEAAPLQLEAPTTARSFGFTNLFFNPFSTVKKLLTRTPAAMESQSPVAMSPESPTIASPSNAAQERRTRNRNARYTPRETNADKRHDIAEKNQERQRISQLEAQLRESQREIEEMRRKTELEKLKAQKEAEQIPGQKRRRSSPTVIPARRPGEKGSFGMVDEYFNYEEPTPDARAKRRRTKMPSPADDSSDDEYDFVHLPMDHTPPSLKRPRNGFRMAAIKDGYEDPLQANHDLRVMHQENSFSKSPLRDSLGTGNKTSPHIKKSSPSTIYNGSLMAMPGDPGYKPENVFRKSEQQLQQQSSPKKDGKMDSAELKARAEEIVKKEKNGENITDEERQLLEKAQRKFGHIAGSGSFSAPEYDSDDSSIMSDDLEEPISPERNAPVSTPPSAKASAAEPTNKSDNMKPPPPPVPAHAQLPQSKPATNDNAIPKALAAVSSATPKAGHSAALARQRELAEKHKPKTGSRLQYVSGVSSSPGAPSSPDVENNMESSLITQGMSTPAGNVDAESFSIYDSLSEEAKEKYGALEEAFFSMAKAEDENERKERDEKEFAEYDRQVKQLRARGF